MVVLAQSTPPNRIISHLNPCRFLQTIAPKIPTTTTSNNLRSQQEIPAIDLLAPGAELLLVKACEEVGFFKVTNHGVPAELISPLEDLVVKFFSLPLHDKVKAGGSTASPLGYRNKNIGINGDVGWLEYLLLSPSSEFISQLSDSIFPDDPKKFSGAVENYVSAVKKVACRVLEGIAEGLRVDQNDAFSRLLKDENSDSLFRVNHYPPCTSEVEAGLGGEKLMGFGEHTDPQIISVLRSNDAFGFEILTRNGDWVSVPPDNKSYFVIVGDSLQVMTNGRFRSVKHRVMVEGKRSRISMIYFVGPPLSQKIAPLPSLMDDGEESLYKEFTWGEFRKVVYKSRLADHRLGFFEKTHRESRFG